jgi:ADP-heptose:LPS heptosyltransferase
VVNRSNVHLVPPGMSLMDASALLSRLDVLVTPDTSLVHIGRSFKVPVVALYSSYPKNINRWKPYGQEVGPVISKHIDNIYDITVDQIMSVYRQILTRYQVTSK